MREAEKLNFSTPMSTTAIYQTWQACQRLFPVNQAMTKSRDRNQKARRQTGQEIKRRSSPSAVQVSHLPVETR